MNILVTGAAGQLGRSVRAATAVSGDTFFYTDICEGYTALDITSREAVRSFVERNNIAAVINCAAYTAVDAAESNSERAALLNSTAPRHLAETMRSVGGLLIHISTDYVFSGKGQDTPYTEDAVCAPTTVYGTTKRQGEEEIIACGGNYLILRTAWLYSEYGHNFVKTMLAKMKSAKEVKVVADQWGTPTYAADLAAAIATIVAQRQYLGNSGIYHYTNGGSTTWHAFAQEIARQAGISSCAVSPCRTADYPTPAQRPAYSVLATRKIAETFGISIAPWQEALARCISNILK